VKNGNSFVDWNKMEGRTVDPFVQKGYNRRAEFKLHNYTEKTERDFFEAMFPWETIPEIASLMTARGRLLGYGPDWSVSRGDVIGFLGYNFSVLIFHIGGPKEDLWLHESAGKYEDSIFSPANLGQFGMPYNYFAKLMRTFELPTHDDPSDPFNPIRKFTDEWNKNMYTNLVPGHIITVDESMGLWKGKGMLGRLFVHRKPTSVGRESHTTADCDTGLLFSWSPTRGRPE
jgi:hypothetical protein